MLHELLSRSRDEIIVRCADKLHARHPDRPKDELLDSIPQFLDELIKAERREAGIDETTSLPDDSPYAREHGEQRYRHGYPPSALPLDYGTISDVIGELAIEQDYHLDPRSYQLLHECIDKAIAQSITEYFALSRTTEDIQVAEWVGGLGHELRNSVATALMAYTALKAGQVGMESRTGRILERSLRRTEALVSQTLAAAHLRAGVDVQRVHINVAECLDDIRGSAVLDRDIQIDLDVTLGLVLHGDPHLLESAFSNLVQNAVKFTRTGGRVTVKAYPVEGGVMVEVLDECGGLGGVNQEEMFEAFVRGKASKTRKGLGLGLAITRQAIEAHGGRVTVRDRAPIGCAFVIYLPNDG